jgi:hypothetical protein
MAANFLRIILFSLIIILIGFQNVAIANQSINLSLSPSEAYLDETTTFAMELTPTQNLSNVVVYFYVDAEKKGAKNLFNIEKNEKYFITFDYFFNKNSYLGEHYIELKIDFVAENQEKDSEHFYAVVDVYSKKKPSAIFVLLIPFLIVVLITGFVLFKYSDTSIIEFKKDERKILFGFVLTIIPISVSIFTLYLTEKPELKIGIFSILLSFIVSFILALYWFIIAEKKSDVEADNLVLCSLFFLFSGLIEMVMLVLFF